MRTTPHKHKCNATPPTHTCAHSANMTTRIEQIMASMICTPEINNCSNAVAATKLKMTELCGQVSAITEAEQFDAYAKTHQHEINTINGWAGTLIISETRWHLKREVAKWHCKQRRGTACVVVSVLCAIPNMTDGTDATCSSRQQ